MLGQRLDGAGPVGVTLVGPAHTSAASAERVVRSPGNDVWLLGRCLVDGARDLPNAYAFQDSMKLLPLGPSVPMRVVPTQSQDPENFLAVSTSSWPATRRQRPRRHCLSVGPSSDCARGRSKSGPNLLIRFAQHGPRALRLPTWRCIERRQRPAATSRAGERADQALARCTSRCRMARCSSPGTRFSATPSAIARRG
jgi:hypothetical protein